MAAREYKNKNPGVVVLTKEISSRNRTPGIYSSLGYLGEPDKPISLLKFECLVFVGHGEVTRRSLFSEDKTYKTHKNYYLTFLVPRLGHLVYVWVSEIMKLPIYEKPRRLLVAYTKKKKISETCWLPEEETL